MRYIDLSGINKDDLIIFNDVMDKILKIEPRNDDYNNNISIYILMGILIIMVIIFLVISRFYYNPNKSSEHNDNKNKEDCLKSGDFCYRTL